MSDKLSYCPVCGQSRMHVNVEKITSGFCEKHKVRWGSGSNLFSRKGENFLIIGTDCTG